ncbi:hypothetical protein A45J_0102 [hot springs metagenome]|uniref:DUF5615 domain-containing protein n=1 Tax=hot springs metagenome TaxID=433727 RepID=A0A5J4L0U4_9ZZZZ
MTTKLKFLVDVGVGKKVEKWLAENDYDIKCMRDINPNADDFEILHLAVTEDRMVITMDKDFGELVYNSGKLHSGVLILRLEDADSSKDTLKGSGLYNYFSLYIPSRSP